MIKPEDLQVIEELSKVSNLTFKHEVLHYLYFQKKSGAAAAVKDLRKTGFEAEKNLSTDRSNWLILAKHQVVPTEEAIDSAVTRMEEVTEKYSGQYDGWEAGVVPKQPVRDKPN